MQLTPPSLLKRLKHAKPDAAEWRKLHDIYLPLIRSWLTRVPGIHDEVDDLSQEVLLVVFRELAEFERYRDGAFRAWLRKITVNRIRAFHKARQKQPSAGLSAEAANLLAMLEDPASEMARQWDRDHDKHVFQKLLDLVQSDFEANTWRAFTRFALDGLSAEQVARELAMSENSVVLAKFRILKRLREEATELID